jgi:hypothetical protein
MVKNMSYFLREVLDFSESLLVLLFFTVLSDLLLPLLLRSEEPALVEDCFEVLALCVV